MTLAVLTIIISQSSCEKVDEALDYALNFEGVFANSNGNQIELTTESNFGSGKFTKIGTGMGSTTVGDQICYSMQRVNDNTWKGSVRESAGGYFNFWTGGEITMTNNGNLLTITPNGNPSYTYTKVSSSGSGGTGSNTEILVNQCVSGNVGDKKIISFTVPSNATKMEIKTFEEAGTCGDRNAADLFVRKGSNPTITATVPYTWVADCASINPNRQDEICVFNSPSPGSWSVMLFGYNTFFASKLKVTIWK